MSIEADEVRRVANLAEIAVGDAELPALVEQLNRIVDYVAQLDQVPGGTDLPAFQAGAESVALREDVVNPVRLARPPRAMAPEMAEGFFLVPVRGTMEEA